MIIKNLYALYSDAEFKITCNNEVIKLSCDDEFGYYFAPIKTIPGNYFKLIVGEDFITASFNTIVIPSREIKWIKKVSCNNISGRYDIEIIESNHEIIELERSLIYERI